MTPRKVLTAGRWRLDDRPVFFVAGDPGPALRRGGQLFDRFGDGLFRLKAVNELAIGPTGECEEIDELLEAGTHLLLDSGIFWLTNEHMRSHGLTMDEALSLAPASIDGFDQLFDRYVKVVTRYGDDLWGYIELDQGGAVNKRKTRKRLHDLGLSPMPVFHPLNDGIDYGSELFEGFDRFCMGNIVQASRSVRLRLISGLWELHREHPDVWVHLLGFTPAGYSLGFPFDSCDSSTWLALNRWPNGQKMPAMVDRRFPIPREFWPSGGDPEARARGFSFGFIDSWTSIECVRHWGRELADGLGIDQFATGVGPT